MILNTDMVCLDAAAAPWAKDPRENIPTEFCMWE